MKWFFTWLNAKIKQTDEDLLYSEKEHSDQSGRRPKASLATHKSLSISRDSELSSRSTTFNLYNANGGYVIELRNYDNSRDTWQHSLHIVPNGEDLGKSIEHIITLEALKK